MTHWKYHTRMHYNVPDDGFAFHDDMLEAIAQGQPYVDPFRGVEVSLPKMIEATRRYIKALQEGYDYGQDLAESLRHLRRALEKA